MRSDKTQLSLPLASETEKGGCSFPGTLGEIEPIPQTVPCFQWREQSLYKKMPHVAFLSFVVGKQEHLVNGVLYLKFPVYFIFSSFQRQLVDSNLLDEKQFTFYFT